MNEAGKDKPAADHHADHHADHQECLACEAGMDGMEEGLEAMIAAFGHAVVATRIDVPEGELSMSFTVGLSRRGLPELMTFALPDHVAQALLNTSADRLSAGQLPTDVGLAEIASPLDVVFKVAAIEKVRRVSLAIEALAGVHAPEVLQMVWPDKSGLFPWDAGFDESLRTRQPILYGAV